MNRLVAAYFAAADAAMPPAAAVAVRQGSRARENSLRLSIVSAPAFIHSPASPKAVTATARHPARVTYCCDVSVAKAEQAAISADMATSLTTPFRASAQIAPSFSSAASQRRENIPCGSSASSTPTPPIISRASSGTASSTSPAPKSSNCSSSSAAFAGIASSIARSSASITVRFTAGPPLYSGRTRTAEAHRKAPPPPRPYLRRRPAAHCRSPCRRPTLSSRQFRPRRT